MLASINCSQFVNSRRTEGSVGVIAGRIGPTGHTVGIAIGITTTAVTPGVTLGVVDGNQLPEHISLLGQESQLPVLLQGVEGGARAALRELDIMAVKLLYNVVEE